MKPFIWLDVTSKCNRKCDYCIRKEDYSQPIGPELTLGEISGLVKEIDPSCVNLSGGEPTLRKDLDSILKILNNTNVGLIYNGINTDKVLELKNTNSLRTIQYSIHENNLAAGHNISNIERLLNKYSDKLVHPMAILTRENIITAKGLVDQLKKLEFLPMSDFQKNIKLKRILAFIPIIPTSTTKNPNLILSKQDLNDLDKGVKEYVLMGASAEEYVKNSLFRGIVGDFSCKNSIPIRADGEVMFCNGYYSPISFGNIKDNPKEAIRKRLEFMDKLDERRKEIYPLIKHDNGFRISCRVQLENLFNHPEIYEPLLE